MQCAKETLNRIYPMGMMHAIKLKYQSVRRADPRPSKDSPNCNRQNRAQLFFLADVSTFLWAQ